MPAIKSFKQSEAEQAEIKKQIDQVLLPYALDWEKSIDMIGAYLRTNHTDDQGVCDVSFDSTYRCIKSLRDVLVWKGAAPRTAKPIATDGMGNVIRDLKGEREARQRAQDREDRERSTKQTLEFQAKDAMQRVAVNQGIENLRAEVASFTARTHSETAKARAEMNAVIKKLVEGRRHLLDVSNAMDEVKKIGDSYWVERWR